MRLLHTETGQFHVIANPGDEPYAILSHTWDTESEQTYQDICAIQASVHSSSCVRILLYYLCRIAQHCISVCLGPSPRQPSRKLWANAAWGLEYILHAVLLWVGSATIFTDPKLSLKIRGACAYARADGHKYIWIDSCCINKDSSQELSEAINSMFRYYEMAVVCYVYLSDVGGGGDDALDQDAFEHSRWHTRGWTLQELLAPDAVVFLSKQWLYVGTKVTLARLLWNRLQIHPEVLTKYRSVEKTCAAQMMSWAATRQTTREEDRAYCLLGLFDVNMPTFYGEGGRQAFIRLQEAIQRRSPDPTIFAWNHASRPTRLTNLAEYTADSGLHMAIVIQRSRVGSIGYHRTDFTSSFATHPADFLIGRSISPLSPARYAERLGCMELAEHDYWAIPPFPSRALIRLPYVPLKACLPPESAAELSPELSNLFLALLPCERVGVPDERDGLLAIVASASDAHVGAGMSKPTQHDFGAHKVLQGLSLHSRRRAEGAALPSSRLVLLTPADLARCRSAVRQGSLLIGARTVRHRLPLIRAPKTSTESEAAAITVELANWCRSALAARGFVVTPLSSFLPASDINDEKLPMGYVLQRDGFPAAIIFEHDPLYRDAFAVQIRFRIGLMEFATAGGVGAGDERWAGTTSWTEWQVLEEGAGYTSKGCLNYPPADSRVRSFFMVTLQYKSHNTYMLGLDFETYNV